MSIDFTVDKSSKPFGFTAVAKDLEQVMSRVNGAMSSSSSQTKLYFLAARNKKLGIVAYSQDTFCAVQVPNAVTDGEGIFGIDPATFVGIIKNRSTLEFNFDGKELAFKLTKGKYSGKLTTVAVADEQLAHLKISFAKGKSDASNVLSRNLLKIMKEGMMLTAVKDVYTSNDLASHIVFSEKFITVSAFDRHHFALYKAKNKDKAFKDFRIVLPVNHFNIIDKMVDSSDKDSKFVMRPESVRVEGSNFLLVLPATQTDDANFTLVQTYLKAQGEMPYQFKYDNEKLTTLVDNLYTLKATNANFEIEFDGKALKFTFNTANGSASDALKVQVVKAVGKGVKVGIDPILLRDLISLAKTQKDVTFGIKKGALLGIECKTESGATLTLASAVEK